ncbi:MAG: electron transfer flavoprotein subunit beta/FixA family protein [Candidatus Neomarinimicrobiota bacterium]
MALKLIVLVKQVPDTKNITAKAMKADGTVNRGELPAIYNPEDLNACEMALDLRERYGGFITVVTMGPPRAADILRESLYRGVDRCVLLTDRAFAGADTLATSYTLALAIRKAGEFDLVLCGRQAIDGDTAQIGPQVAEKLGINQITYVQRVRENAGREIILSRNLGRVAETIKTRLPLLITVTSSANQPRTFGAKLTMKYKKARTHMEIERELNRRTASEDAVNRKYAELDKRGLIIETWSAADLNADLGSIGLAGSPTKVKKVENIVFATSKAKNIEPTEKGIRKLLDELIEEHTFG